MTSSPLPETVTLNLAARIPLTLQRIEPGSFRMGSRGYDHDEEPMHRVEITRPYYIGIFPVTQAQFSVWTTKCCIEHKNGFPNHPNHPAGNLDWLQAVAFCQWLNETCATEIPPGYRAGLPSEAEWEYACRAGTNTEYWSGDGEAALSKVGWWSGNAKGTTHPVGAFGEAGRNLFGLSDIHGHVLEWCDDGGDEHAYKKRIDGVRDPLVPVSSNDWKTGFRAMRGGSFAFSSWECRSARRNRWTPVFRFDFQGLRVCLFSGPIRNSDGSPDLGDGVSQVSMGQSS